MCRNCDVLKRRTKTIQRHDSQINLQAAGGDHRSLGRALAEDALDLRKFCERRGNGRAVGLVYFSGLQRADP